MKKKLFIGLAGVAAIAVAVGVTLMTVNNNSKSNYSDLITQNIEALTQNEGSGATCTGPKSNFGKVVCKCENSVPCRDSYGCD